MQVIKNLIMNSPFKRIVRFLLGGRNSGSASIDPIITYLKDRFKNTKDLKVLEIGARYGDSSLKIISNLSVYKYVIIDPYETYQDYENDGFDNVIKLKGADHIFNETRKRLEGKVPVLLFHRNYSNDKKLIKNISEEMFDLIFIDGNHEYKYVFDDLQNYYPLLEDGGVLCGDDYHTRSKKNDWLGTIPAKDKRPMVYEAVKDFSEKNNLNYLSFGNHRGYPKIFVFEKN